MATDMPADTAATEERWQRMWSHREQLLKVARRRSMSREDAEDAVHEAMLRAAERPDLDDERLGAWLTTVTMRLCVDRYRQVNREAEVGSRPTLLAPGPVPVEEAVCDRAEAKWLAVRSGELPARQAVALRLKSEDLDVGQVAVRMGLSYRTVESLLARARRTLRASLARDARSRAAPAGARPAARGRQCPYSRGHFDGGNPGGGGVRAAVHARHWRRRERSGAATGRVQRRAGPAQRGHGPGERPRDAHSLAPDARGQGPGALTHRGNVPARRVRVSAPGAVGGAVPTSTRGAEGGGPAYRLGGPADEVGRLVGPVAPLGLDRTGRSALRPEDAFAHAVRPNCRSAIHTSAKNSSSGATDAPPLPVEQMSELHTRPKDGTGWLSRSVRKG
ncbi:RNA polymerase sigma factor [Streptomyces sp. NPDC093261]|uniref:RNA polymerase sigma factor n=1 Tax=Streptomyces sp. NPDC093261 TaxID=3366037 RepID=UPI0038219167